MRIFKTYEATDPGIGRIIDDEFNTFPAMLDGYDLHVLHQDSVLVRDGQMYFWRIDHWEQIPTIIGVHDPKIMQTLRLKHTKFEQGRVLPIDTVDDRIVSCDICDCLTDEGDECLYCGDDICENCTRICEACHNVGCLNCLNDDMLCPNCTGQKCDGCGEKYPDTALYDCGSCGSTFCINCYNLGEEKCYGCISEPTINVHRITLPSLDAFHECSIFAYNHRLDFTMVWDKHIPYIEIVDLSPEILKIFEQRFKVTKV